LRANNVKNLLGLLGLISGIIWQTDSDWGRHGFETGLNLVMLVWVRQILCEWAAHLSEAPDSWFNGIHSSFLGCTPFPQFKSLPF
jgi:hypothetical protein